jgi:hypothetical protein
MNNNIYSNQELLKHKLFLEQLFLLDIEPKETLDRNLASAPEPLLQHLDKQHSVAASQTKAKTSINPISVYALAVTLLLLLPSNRDRADGKTVAVSQEQKQIELLSAKLQQLESQTEILAVEIASNQKQPNPAVEYSTQSPSVVETDPATTVQAEAPLELAPAVSYNQPNSLKLPEYQLPAIPIPTPPPPTLWQSDSADAANVIQPLKSQHLLLPVAVLPSFSDSLQPGLGTISNSAQLPAPPLLIETGAEANIAPTSQQVQQPIQQWLGQTDMVYYSHSYGRQDEATVEQSSIDESVSTAQQQNESDLRQYLTSTPLAETLLEQNSLDANLVEDSISIAESLPHENESSIEEEVVPALDQEPTQQQSLMVDSEDLDLALYLDSIPLLEEQSQAETESSNTMVETPVSQPSLFSDEDLAGYLSSTPLLDEKTIQQALGTSPARETEVEQQTDSTVTVNPVETVAVKTSEPTQELEVESKMQPSSISTIVDQSEEQLTLFADEDLKQFLTSTPLFSDEILKQKLQ